MEQEDGTSKLARMCIDAACSSSDSVRIWRRQKRTLAKLPFHLAEPLFHTLLSSRLLSAPLLESFQHSLQIVQLSGHAMVDAQWMAYLAEFRFLRALSISDCKLITNSSLRSLKSLDCLEEIDISRCPKVTDEGLQHLCSLKTIKKLALSETGVGIKGLYYLASLTYLTFLDVGGLPVTDGILSSLLALNQLEHLNVWGSKITNSGALLLQTFPHLQSLNLAWTSITVVPPLLSLRCLNMSQCKVISIFDGWTSPQAPLYELHLSRSDIRDAALAGDWTRNVVIIDLSSASVENYRFLGELKSMNILDLSGTSIQNNSLLDLAEAGSNIRWLDLSGTKVNSEGVGALAGNVPKLEQISLSGTMVDDSVLSFLGLMPNLREIDLSHTAVKGLVAKSTFPALEHLQHLRTFNLQNTLVSNKSCRILACLRQLSHLFLRGDFLSDASLQFLSTITDLVLLSVQAAMLTDSGLLHFNTPPLLQELDITDCWLLTKKGILEFCETNPGLLVVHGHLSNELELKDPHSRRSKRRDAQEKGFISHVSWPLKSLISLKICQKTKQRSTKERSIGPYGRKQDSPSLRISMRTIDERVKYNMSELLNLRQSPLSNQYLEGLELGECNDV